MAWQAATLTALALILGVPAGLVCGRLAWQIFAGQLGILPVLVIPLLWLATMPGASAARTRPAEVLRAE